MIRSFTFKGCIPANREASLAEDVARAFADAADTAAMAGQLRQKPKQPDDIGKVEESWRFGVAPTLIVRRRSDWDWHDLRGIYLTGQEFQVEAEGLPSEHRFQMRLENDIFDLHVSLAEPAFDSVMRAVRSALDWSSEEAVLLALLPALGDAWRIPELRQEVLLERLFFAPVVVSDEIFAALRAACSVTDDSSKQKLIYEHLGLLLRCAAGRYDEALERVSAFREESIPVKQLSTFESWCLMQKGAAKESLAALRTETESSPAWQWFMLEALVELGKWTSFIACAKRFTGKEIGRPVVLEDHEACLLQAEALCRMGKPQKALLRLKRAICLNPWNRPLDFCHSIPNDLDSLIQKLAPMFAPLRAIPEYSVLASQPFLSPDGFAKNPSLVAALCEIPPFTMDWNPEAPFDVIDLESHDNSRKELERALVAITDEGLGDWRPPWLALRGAIILGKLRRISEALSLVDGVLKNHPRNATARKLRAELRKKE